MTRHFTIHVHATNRHGVLARVLLAFSRRRLRVRALQFFDLEEKRPAEMQIDVDCEPAQARDVIAQLRAVVEVTQVWAEEIAVDDSVTTPAKLAAA